MHNMKPGYRALIILLGGLLFYVITGDISVALLLTILLSYFEFRKKGHNY